MNGLHVRRKLVLSREWTFWAGKALAAVAASSCAPELLCELVDRIMVTVKIRGSCKCLVASWPIATDPSIRGVLTGGHVTTDGLCRRGRGAAAYLAVGASCTLDIST
jgi:hypothetical protein